MKIEPMSLQQLFDKVFAGMKAQGFHQSSELRLTQSGNREVQCLYRDPPSRRKCAAGHAIPDCAYTPDMEGFSIEQVNDKFKLGFGVEQEQLLIACQRAHDVATTTLEREQMLRGVAKKGGLLVEGQPVRDDYRTDIPGRFGDPEAIWVDTDKNATLARASEMLKLMQTYDQMQEVKKQTPQWPPLKQLVKLQSIDYGQSQKKTIRPVKVEWKDGVLHLAPA